MAASVPTTRNYSTLIVLRSAIYLNTATPLFTDRVCRIQHSNRPLMGNFDKAVNLGNLIKPAELFDDDHLEQLLISVSELCVCSLQELAAICKA